MDTGLIAGLITAIGAAIAAVIGALALLRRASGPYNAALSALRSLWDWVEFHEFADQVPARIRRRVLDVLDLKDNHDIDADDKPE